MVAIGDNGLAESRLKRHFAGHCLSHRSRRYDALASSAQSCIPRVPHPLWEPPIKILPNPSQVCGSQLLPQA